MPTAAVHNGLTLCILGAAEFAGEGAENANGILEQPMRLALLVYLAASLPRGFRRRDELLALLWADSDAPRARNSLRQSLHVLRQRLPADTVLARGSAEVALSGQLRVDSELFEDHLDHGREEEALVLYRGDFLQGCHLTDNPEFEEWLDAERERLRRRAVHGALVLAKRCEWDGHSVNATRWASFAESRAPYDEDVLHEVVGLFERLGDRGGAVRLHAAGVERFQSQLGISLAPYGEPESLGVHDHTARRRAMALSGRTRTPAVRPALSTDQVAFVPPRARRVSAEARRLYLEARQFVSQRSPATIDRAIEAFNGAVRLAPDYAEAHAGLAFSLAGATVYVGYPGIDAWPRIRTHASRAIRLDPSLGEAHAMLAQATLCHDYDWTSAERMYRNALELDPVSDILRLSFAHYLLTATGRLDEALDVLNRLRDTIPSAAGVSYFCAMSCVYGRWFERGRDEAAMILERQPEFAMAHWTLGMAQEGMGDLDAAIHTFETGLALTNGSSLLLTQVGRASARAGDHERARQILSELDRRGEHAGPAAYFEAEILAALGDVDAAIDSLYASYRQRNPMMIFAGVLYGLDPLREKRRFHELLMRMGIRVHDATSVVAGERVSARTRAG